MSSLLAPVEYRLVVRDPAQTTTAPDATEASGTVLGGVATSGTGTT